MSEIVAAFKLPISIEHLDTIARTLEAIYGKNLYFHEEDFRNDGRWLRFEKRDNDD